MKKVFSSNSDLSHVWAQQTQLEGRTKNMFFRGTEIYSYGEHFLAAKFHRNFVLVNSDNYSVSTAKQLGEITSALRGLVNYYRVPNPSNPKAQENIDYVLSNIELVYSRAEKMMKVTSNTEYNYFVDRLKDALGSANEFFQYADIDKTAFMDTSRCAAIEIHLLARYKRYCELNTPEMIAIKKAKAQAKLEGALQADIDLFRDGVNRHSLYKLPFDLLRIAGNEVITSRGARVPLDAAKTMLKAILDNRAKSGDTIASFTLEKYDTETVKIGCHTIKLSEAIEVLGMK